MTSNRSRYRRIVVEPKQTAHLPGGRTPPLWMRTTFIDDASPYREIDRVFLPVEAFGKPLDLLLSACHDGAPLISEARHVYAPASWLMRACPETADKALLIADRVLQATRRR